MQAVIPAKAGTQLAKTESVKSWAPAFAGVTDSIRSSVPVVGTINSVKTTWFLPEDDGRSARKRWIAGSLHPAGTITIDPGAARALTAGRSLLPAGVRAIDGDFERGDPVLIQSTTGTILARGLSAYASTDARRIAGHNSADIESILGWRGRDELIHRDDLTLT